jgi:hypothetical protein
MKTKILLATLVSTFYLAPATFGQGVLTPPGAPAPSMKTLAQIEPRTPISSAPLSITTPGSYYLTTNLTISSGAAISVSANNITLDLNGFTIFSTETPAASSVGISLNSGTNISIFHGFICGGVIINAGTYSGSGFANGIYASNAVNARVSGVSVCGCLYSGVFLGNNSVVESCTVTTAGSYGIYATAVSDTTAQNCGLVGVYAANSANNCCGAAFGAGTGVSANAANNCNGTAGADGTGVYASSAINCIGTAGASGTGVNSVNAINCYGTAGTGGTGVSAVTANNCTGATTGGEGVGAYNANNCNGASSGSGFGINAGYIATGCFGESDSGTGVNALIASVCHGATFSGVALSTTHNINSY